MRSRALVLPAIQLVYPCFEPFLIAAAGEIRCLVSTFQVDQNSSNNRLGVPGKILNKLLHLRE
jgi:hypothetical protein